MMKTTENLFLSSVAIVDQALMGHDVNNVATALMETVLLFTRVSLPAL